MTGDEEVNSSNPPCLLNVIIQHLLETQCELAADFFLLAFKKDWFWIQLPSRDQVTYKIQFYNIYEDHTKAVMKQNSENFGSYRTFWNKL